MKRPASGEKNLDRILAWRAMNPEADDPLDLHRRLSGRDRGRIRVSAGLPERGADDRLGCFAYSPVEGATANLLDNPVPEEVREERRARVMLLQEEISAKRLQAKVGRTMRVLVDEVGGKEAIGRSAADAPEIDGVVHIKRSLVPGKRLVVGDSPTW